MSTSRRRLTISILAIVFIICAIVTTTLCWQNLNQVALSYLMEKNNLSVNVELIKLDKAENEKPISGTVFYLFKQDGEQIGGRYITDENGKINVTLTKGEYYFEEITPSIGYTFDEENGKKITKYYFTVQGQPDEKVTIKAYNIRLNGSLLVQNTVKNSDGSQLTEVQRNQEFVYTITFSDGVIYSYSIDNGDTKTIESGETFILKHGQTAVFDEIPVGVLYNITQTPVDGYVTESSGHRGNITEDESIAKFTNIYMVNNVGSITVTKEVIGENADLNKRFNFTLTMGEKQEIFTLADGESKTFSGIPIGTEYVVTEEDLTEEGYTPTIKKYTGEITGTEEVFLPFVNIYDKEPDESKGAITITKEVIGENADLDKEFTFEINFSGENAPENKTFKLKAGENITFDDIPNGVTYIIQETDANGYIPVTESISGTISGKQTINVDFENTVPRKNQVKLSITKELKGEYLKTDEQKEFEFTLLIDGVETKFTLKANETKEFDIPVGASYEIQENNYISDGYIQEISNGSGIAYEDDITATVTNTYVGEIKTIITGEKTWEFGNNAEVSLPESITIKLKNGDLIFDEKEVKPDENGNWKYSFIAPKYDADGEKINYSVEEATVKSFIPTYNKYNITNTYIEPIEVTLPALEKVTIGSDIPKTKFEFVLEAQDNAPMQEDSNNNKNIVSLNGEGKVEFDKIIFTNPGVYTYKIYELNGGFKGWEYDETIYTVTITVTEKKGKLNSKTVIEKEQKATEEIVFTNLFDQSILGENVIVAGQKTWDHGSNPENEQPKSIIINVYGDGKLTVQKQVAESDNWKYSFELPKYAENGQMIEYTIDEVDVPGYTKTINGYDINNKYVEETGPTVDKPTDSGNSSTPSNPQTGDDIQFWFAMMIITGTLFIILHIASRKKGKH